MSFEKEVSYSYPSILLLWSYERKNSEIFRHISSNSLKEMIHANGKKWQRVRVIAKADRTLPNGSIISVF